MEAIRNKVEATIINVNNKWRNSERAWGRMSSLYIYAISTTHKCSGYWPHYGRTPKHCNFAQSPFSWQSEIGPTAIDGNQGGLNLSNGASDEELILYLALFSDQSQAWKLALWLESHFFVRLTTCDTPSSTQHSLMPLSHRVQSTPESIEDYVQVALKSINLPKSLIPLVCLSVRWFS
jgi:hypothetical protein